MGEKKTSVDGGQLGVESAIYDVAGFYPKRYEVIIDQHPEDPSRIVVRRTVTNMSAFELYGLLLTLTRAVEAQCQFPVNQRSDGIDVVDRRGHAPEID